MTDPARAPDDMKSSLGREDALWIVGGGGLLQLAHWCSAMTLFSVCLLIGQFTESWGGVLQVALIASIPMSMVVCGVGAGVITWFSKRNGVERAQLATLMAEVFGVFVEYIYTEPASAGEPSAVLNAGSIMLMGVLLVLSRIVAHHVHARKMAKLGV